MTPEMCVQVPSLRDELAEIIDEVEMDGAAYTIIGGDNQPRAVLINVPYYEALTALRSHPEPQAQQVGASGGGTTPLEGPSGVGVVGVGQTSTTSDWTTVQPVEGGAPLTDSPAHKPVRMCVSLDPCEARFQSGHEVSKAPDEPGI